MTVRVHGAEYVLPNDARSRHLGFGHDNAVEESRAFDPCSTAAKEDTFESVNVGGDLLALHGWKCQPLR